MHLTSNIKHQTSNIKHNTEQNGQVIVIVIATLMFFTIAVAMITFFLHNESKWTIKEKRSATAFHLAEAGLDRGYWKLSESTDHWDTIIKGGSIPLYNGTTTFTDISGGEYKIWITSTNSNTVLIRSVGRDTSKNEIRAIEAEYYKGKGIETAIDNEAEIQFLGHAVVHWGPMVSHHDIELYHGSQHRLYSRKICSDSIQPWDDNPALPNYYPITATEENYAGKAFDTSLTDPQEIDFNYYREKAKATTIPNPKAEWYEGGTSSPYYGTGYLNRTGEDIVFNNYKVDLPNGVIYIESDETVFLTDDRHASNNQFKDWTFMRLEAMIIPNGRVNYRAWGRIPYTVKVPRDAWKQYLAGTVKGGINNTNRNQVRYESGPPDTAAIDEYPGDAGLNTCYPTWQLPHNYDRTQLGIWKPKDNCGVAFHGFMYTKQFGGVGGNNIFVGSIKAKDFLSVYHQIIYYDADVAQKVKLINSEGGGIIRRASWKEVLVKSF